MATNDDILRTHYTLPTLGAPYRWTLPEHKPVNRHGFMVGEIVCEADKPPIVHEMADGRYRIDYRFTYKPEIISDMQE